MSDEPTNHGATEPHTGSAGGYPEAAFTVAEDVRATSPAFTIGTRLGRWAPLLPFCYTLFVVILPQNTASAWIGLTRPITRVVSTLVPSVGMIAADLIERGFPQRAPIVGNILAFQWLLYACAFIAAGMILTLERIRFPRRFIAAANERRLLLKPSTWAARRPFVLLFAFCLLIFFYGSSRARGAYDLATGDSGLFFPFLMGPWIWWIVAYHYWHQFLAFMAPADFDEPENKSR